VIEVKNISKSYKLNKKQMLKEKSNNKTKIAVLDLSFEAKENEIFGLLGPNGAGKTTTLRCIATLLKPTAGEIKVQGYDTVKQSKEVRQRICFLTNELKLDEHFSPKYTMEYFGKLYGLDDNLINSRRNMLFDYFGINEFQNMKIGELSTGMKQKLSIAVSLVHDPQVIIFDEPTNGLDIITAKAVTDYLKELKKQGKIIIISTHIMSVAEKLCDKVAIIIDGEIKSRGTVKEIIKENQSEDLEDAFFEIYNCAIMGEI